MRRFALLLSLALLSSACASSVEPSPSPAPPPAEAPGPDAPDAEPTDAPDPAPEPARAPAFRTAPDRWWHLSAAAEGVPGAGVDSAHALLRGLEPGRRVVVAVIDGGIDVDHEDLDDVLWVNDDEVPGNGVDDDGNGYVDDVHGWNFIGGADGENVDYDTFEVTRLHAACIGAPAAGSLESPGPEACERIAEAYEAEVAEMEGLAGQITQLERVYPVVLGILRDAVPGEPTPEKVAAMSPRNARVGQAREFYLQLAAAGIDQETLADEGESIRGRLEYGLSTDFDPRPVVGDDYADGTERVYGNPDVTGPDAGHGTAVASVIGAERGNGLGIEGVSDAVRIMALRAVPNGDERDKDVANAIRYAVDNGADIVNMSFGKDYSPRKTLVDEAVRYADERGVLLVHAAGNDGEDLADVANFPNDRYEGGGSPALWIEVGASAWQGPDSLAASFSNYGAAEVDVFAPGQALRMAAPGNEYDVSDGTSFAAPVVSGVAALLMAYFPRLDAADVRRIILETASDVRENRVVRPGGPGGPGGTVRFGDLSATGGIVNAAAAVRRAMELTAADAGGGR